MRGLHGVAHMTQLVCCLKQKGRTSKVAREHLNGTGFLHIENWILSRLSQSSFLGKWGTHYKAMKINIWCNFFYKIPKNIKPFDCSWKGITQQLCLFVCFVSNYGQLFGRSGFQWKIQTPVSCLVTWRQCTRTGWVAYVLSLVRNGAASGKHKFNCWIKILQSLPIFRMSWMKTSSTNPFFCARMRAAGICSTDLDLQFMLSSNFCNA